MLHGRVTGGVKTANQLILVKGEYRGLPWWSQYNLEVSFKRWGGRQKSLGQRRRKNYINNIRVIRGGASLLLLALEMEEGGCEPRGVGKPLEAGKGKETDFPPEST